MNPRGPHPVYCQWSWHDDRFRFEQAVAEDVLRWHDEIVFDRMLASLYHMRIWPRMNTKFYNTSNLADEAQDWLSYGPDPAFRIGAWVDLYWLIGRTAYQTFLASWVFTVLVFLFRVRGEKFGESGNRTGRQPYEAGRQAETRRCRRPLAASLPACLTDGAWLVGWWCWVMAAAGTLRYVLKLEYMTRGRGRLWMNGLYGCICLLLSLLCLYILLGGVSSSSTTHPIA